MSDEYRCSHCRHPLPSNTSGMRHYGTSTAHLEADCLRYLHDDISALKEELAAVLEDWNGLVAAIGSPTNGGAIGHGKALNARVEEHEKVCAGVWVPVGDVEPPYEDYSVIRTVDGEFMDGMHYWPEWISDDDGHPRPPTWENDEGTFVLEPEKVMHVCKLKLPGEQHDQH